MAIQEKLWELRFRIAFAAVVAGAAISLLSAGPSLATVVSFFWPLLLSTGFCIAAVAVLLRISPPPPPEAACDRAGEEIMDFVAAGQHQAPHEEVAEAERGHEPSPEGEEHQEEQRKGQ